MGWTEFIAEQFEEEYFQELDQFLTDDAKEHTIYPPKKDIFKAFELTPLDSVKVVLLAQDPYINKDEAMGLAFSVPEKQPIPPSLRNIFTEIKNDLKLGDEYKFANGNLTSWAAQGVLLLNSVMTVREGESGSHRGQNWETFTDNAISLLNELDRPIVYLLFGSYAQSKAKLITGSKAHIITGVHPSPLSAYRGFFGGRYFSRTNAFLEKNGIQPIDWRV